MTNGFGYSVQSLQWIAHSTRTDSDLIINCSPNQIHQCIDAYAKKTGNILFGLEIDATKVASFLKVNTTFGVVCGESAPNHCRSIDELQESNDVPNNKYMATEIKCAILTLQYSPENVSPFKIIAARPQTTNQCFDDFNKDCIVKAQ